MTDVLQRVLAFERNLVLRAGAGTGKTEALTSLYVHLLAGATARGRPVPVERIVAVTFTEKAAGEMRARIGAVLRHLAGRSAGPAPRIAELLAATGKAGEREIFRRALDALPSARVTTLHALCASLVRAYAVDAHVDPRFEVLDERRAQALLEEAIVLAVAARLRQGDGEVAALLRDVGAVSGGHAGGLAKWLQRLHAEIAESGADPQDLIARTPLGETNLWRALREAARVLGVAPDDAIEGRVGGAWRVLVESHASIDEGSAAKLEEIRRAVEEVRGWPAFGAHDVAALQRAAAALSTAIGSAKAKDVEAPKRVREAVEDLWVLPRASQRASAVLRLLEDVGARYREAKERRDAVDFADLSRAARDLLRDCPTVRREVVAGIDALMVDELQDTSALQRDVVLLLRARPEVEARVPAGAEEILPTGLFVVGDRKQSIYGFRGADVTVFERIAEDVRAGGGDDLSLRTSWRSVRPLVEAQNALARASLGAPATHAFEIALDEREVLEPAREGHPSGGPHLELLGLAEDEGRERAEAVALARRAATIVLGPDPLEVRDRDGAWRRARFGDIALLLSRFTYVALYLRALDGCGVPYVVVGGRGLTGTVEARDLAALGQVLAGDDDGRAILAVLRSPFVALSDTTLVAISAEAGRAWPELVDRPIRLAAPATAAERARFERIAPLLRRLRDEVDRIGFGAAMRAVVTESGYAAIAAALPGGRQRVANIDKILGEIGARERAGEDGRLIVSDFARRVAAEEPDPEADVATEGADALRVMTVHQAKGLEFPIVLAGDLGRRLWSPKQPFALDRDPTAGLAVAVRAPEGRWIYGGHLNAVHAIAEKRERAEAMRRFYVQITRASDHLVLAGKNDGIQREVVAKATPDLLARRLAHPRPAPTLDEVIKVSDTSITPVHSSSPGTPPETTGKNAEVIKVSDTLITSDLARRVGSAAARVRTLEVPVTQLEDFALCPRRYRARHVLALPEHPRPRVPPEPEDGEDSPALDEVAHSGTRIDPRRRGTLAHRALERLDLALAAREPRAAVERALVAAGAAGDPELRDRITPYAAGAYVKALASLPERAVRRELPFSLAVALDETTLVLRGQIDLVVELEDALEVIDYKTSSPRGPVPTEPYHFQLGAYTLAVRRAEAADTPVRAGIQFLDGRAHLPVYAPEPATDLSRTLPRLAKSFAQARAAETYTGRPLRECERLGCGYRWLCHAQLM